MAKRAPLTLADLAPDRGGTTPGVPESGRKRVENGSKKDTRRGQLLRLEPEAWKQLKLLGVDQGKPVHALLIEAVNLLFDRYQRPTIAG